MHVCKRVCVCVRVCVRVVQQYYTQPVQVQYTLLFIARQNRLVGGGLLIDCLSLEHKSLKTFLRA